MHTDNTSKARWQKLFVTYDEDEVKFWTDVQSVAAKCKDLDCEITSIGLPAQKI
jgi:hypothetical protein